MNRQRVNWIAVLPFCARDDQNRLRRRCAAGVDERTGECFPAGLSESAYKTADFPPNLNCYAAFSARTTASDTFFAERGFCPVIRRPSTSTCERNGSPFVYRAKSDLSLSSSKNGICLLRCTKSSSRLVKPATVLPSSKCLLLESTTGTKAAGPWHTAATMPPLSYKVRVISAMRVS